MASERGVSRQASEALRRYNELLSEHQNIEKAIAQLDAEGYVSRNGIPYNIKLLRTISSYSGVKMEKLKSQQKVKVDEQLLKRACIDMVVHSLGHAAEKYQINRETLRIRLKKRYPYISKNKNNLRLRLYLAKLKTSGIYFKNGFIFDLCRKPILDQYNCLDNGNGYCKIGNYYYHRLITACPPDMEVDHINRNKSDNRVENLRIVNRLQNVGNRKKKLYQLDKRTGLKKRYKNTVGLVRYWETKEEAIAESKKNDIEKYGEYSAYA